MFLGACAWREERFCFLGSLASTLCDFDSDSAVRHFSCHSCSPSLRKSRRERGFGVRASKRSDWIGCVSEEFEQRGTTMICFTGARFGAVLDSLQPNLLPHTAIPPKTGVSRVLQRHAATSTLAPKVRLSIKICTAFSVLAAAAFDFGSSSRDSLSTDLNPSTVDPPLSLALPTKPPRCHMLSLHIVMHASLASSPDRETASGDRNHLLPVVPRHPACFIVERLMRSHSSFLTHTHPPTPL